MRSSFCVGISHHFLTPSYSTAAFSLFFLLSAVILIELNSASKTGYPCIDGKCDPCNLCVNGYCQVRDADNDCSHPCRVCSHGECRWDKSRYLVNATKDTSIQCGQFPCSKVNCPDCHVCLPDFGCLRDNSREECREGTKRPCIQGKCPRCFDCINGDCVQNYTRIACPLSPSTSGEMERCGASVCPDCYHCVNSQCVQDYITPRCYGGIKLTQLCNGIPCPKCFKCYNGACRRDVFDTDCNSEPPNSSGNSGKSTTTSVSGGSRGSSGGSSNQPDIIPRGMICGRKICPLCYSCINGECALEDVNRDCEMISNITRELIVNPLVNTLLPTDSNNNNNNNNDLCNGKKCPKCQKCDKALNFCIPDITAPDCTTSIIPGISTAINKTSTTIDKLIPDVDGMVKNLTEEISPITTKLIPQAQCIPGQRACPNCQLCQGSICVPNVLSAECRPKNLRFSCDDIECPPCHNCVYGACVRELFATDCSTTKTTEERPNLQTTTTTTNSLPATSTTAAKILRDCAWDIDCPTCFRCDVLNRQCIPDFENCRDPPEACFQGNCPLCYECVSGYCFRNETQQAACSSKPFSCGSKGSGPGRCPYCFACSARTNRCEWDSGSSVCAGRLPRPCIQSDSQNGCPDCYKCSTEGYCIRDILNFTRDCLVGDQSGSLFP